MEVWRDIDGYEGFYQVSDMGNVRSIDRDVRYKNGCLHKYAGQVLKQQRATNGYMIVDLQKNKAKRHFLVHRLVAITFIKNETGFPEVNHKDENKENNTVENLEWVTVMQNRNFGTRNIRGAANKDYTRIAAINREKQGKKVLQMDKNGNAIKMFPSLHAIEEELGFFRAFVSGCCKGRYKQAYGYLWKFI